ncbi:WD40 repeat domain-containing protein, partial [Caminibacter sp.]
MKVEKIINLKHPISLLKYINGKIGVIDKLNTFRMFDVSNFSLIGGFKIKLPENNPLENSVDISPYGNYLAVAIKGKRKTTIWDINQKKLIHTLGWHKGEVLSVSFDYDENYLITGGMDGRAYLWSVELGKMVSSLPPHPDYILSSAFSKNSLWAATGSYDKMISITNISSMNINYRKKSHRGAVTKIKFLKNRMISGDKTGELIVWDYAKGKIISRMHNVADMVIDMGTDEKEEYLFVITKTKYVYLYDLKTYELITDKFITLSELPSSITYVQENTTLWIGTLGGSIYIFDIYS